MQLLEDVCGTTVGSMDVQIVWCVRSDTLEYVNEVDLSDNGDAIVGPN
jgi:hypothetical protein